jgi:signal transduction histidine kinase
MASHFQLPFSRARRAASPLDTYLGLVAVAGLLVCVWLLRDVAAAFGHVNQQIVKREQVPLSQVQLTFWLLAACAFPAELIRVNTRHQGGGNQVTMSRPFVLALLIGWGAPLAAAVFVVASVVTDLIHRRPALRIPFNAGQYALSIAAAAAIYRALGGQPALGLAQVPAFSVATLVLILVNRLTVRVAVALYQQHPMSLGYLLAEAQVELVEAAVQSSMVLVALLVAGHRPLLAALLALPALPLVAAGRASEQIEALMARRRGLGGDELADLEHRREASHRTVELQLAKLAADLHDGPVQTFQQLRAQLAIVKAAIAAGNPDAARLLHEVEERVDAESRHQRLMVAELQPPVLQRQGLPEALTRLAEKFQTTGGIECTVQAETGEGLSQELTTLLWRVTQEALTNVVKHAHATHVRVRVAVDDGVVRLEIHDDGTGFDPEGVPGGHFGLALMRRRVVGEFDGDFRVVSTPDHGGTTITVEIHQ